MYADTALEPHVASSQDGYARHRDEGLAGAVSHVFDYLVTFNYCVSLKLINFS